MGRQIKYFMSDDDVAEFMSFLTKEKDIAILAYTQPSLNATPLERLPEERHEIVFLWNRAISPMPTYSYIDKQKYFVIDSSTSEVIEFLRGLGIVTRKTITEGRIWIENSYYDENGILIKKNPAFIKWYESLVRWIRKNSLEKSRFHYVMPHAYELFHNTEQES